MDKKENKSLLEKKILSVIGFACNPKRDGDSISMEESLESLNIDSLSFIELVIKIENEFGIRFDENVISISNFFNVKSLVGATSKCLENNY